ncbi:MAG: hypothetical protein RLY61_15 [Candidatus Parcubacteria bacterium]|jgi:hypothetical protein
MKDFIKIDSVLVVCITLVALAAIISYAQYKINDRNLMSNNIKDAITSGVNPLSVRCSYAKSDDAVCVAYSFSGNTSIPSSNKK